MLDHAEESIKVIVVGDGNVGKTCMLRRFVKGDFIEQYRKTIGAEFMEKDVFLRSSNTTVKLMLWDTAGQEVFNALTQAYYRGAGAAVLAFSTVDRDSFMNIAGWKQRVESVCGPITMVLCQTKFDLSHEAVITNEEAEQLASQLGVPLFRVSTKDDFNVTQLFEFTAQRCIEDAAAATESEAAVDEEADAVEDECRPAETHSDGEKHSVSHVAAEPTAGTGSSHPPAAAAAAAASSSPQVKPDTSTPPRDGLTTSTSAAAAAAPFIPVSADKTGKNTASAAGAAVGGGGKAKSNGTKEKTAGSPSKNKVSLKDEDGQTHHRKRKFKCSLY